MLRKRWPTCGANNELVSDIIEISFLEHCSTNIPEHMIMQLFEEVDN